MELAVAALGKVFTGLGLAGASAGGTAAATGATAAAGGAAAGSGALSALQGIATTLKVLGGIGAGVAARNEAEDAAVQTELQSGQEQLQSTQRQTSMKRELARVLGQNDVIYAAAGIDLSGGIAQQTAAEQKARATDEISIEQQDSEFRRALYRLRARGQRSAGRSAMRGALIGAIGDVAQYGMDVGNRG
ncbi:hypothetical protein [Sinorhizobium fredii]|uniref:hypothetical protein n=1 Tax=Rhizobium fredii TaxID=380 RepID=UPI0004BC65F4|nr:hypothetical protein [Sinorhizobium fredii]ASY69386.1 hypothetical protein SF83666_c19700 [Sinorhizobium fredii CCBAU 83666]